MGIDEPGLEGREDSKEEKNPLEGSLWIAAGRLSGKNILHDISSSDRGLVIWKFAV